MSKENVISLYKINTEHEDFINTENLSDFANIIKTKYSKKEEEKNKKNKSNYIEINLQKEFHKSDLFNLFVYHSTRTNENAWNNFLDDFIGNGNKNDLKKLINQNHDILTLIQDKNNPKLVYAITAGIASNLINSYIDESFPLEVMMKIIDPEKIKKAKNRSLSGSYYARDFYFRGDYKISSTEFFGSIWKDVSASIKESILNDADFKNIFNNKKEINCDVGSYFKFRKKISLEKSLNLISKINTLPELKDADKKEFDFLKSVKIIKNKDLKIKLGNKLLEDLYNHIIKNTDISYDLCHKNYQDYLEADKYQLYFGNNLLDEDSNPKDFNEIIDFIKKNNTLPIVDIDSFSSDIQKIQIKSINQTFPDKNCTDCFIGHLNGEISYNSKNYFIIDKEYYEIEDSFIKTLQDDYYGFISKNGLIESFLNEWKDGETEDEFNFSHDKNDNFYVGHKIFFKKIELFDILHVDDKNKELYLIHVKNKLNGSIRDLCSQLRNSAKIIEETTKSIDSNSLIEYYNTAITHKSCQEKTKEKLEALSKEGFVDIFKKYKINHIIAFKNDIEPSKISSNISKLEIINTRDYIKQYNADFKLIHINKLVAAEEK